MALLEPKMGGRKWSKTGVKREAEGKWWWFLYTLLLRAWTHPGADGQTWNDCKQENDVIRQDFRQLALVSMQGLV